MVLVTKKPSILVVDDVLDGREMLVEYLTFRGFQVAEATTGIAALAMARALRPQIVLMDLSMPGIDGWETTRRLKTDPLTKDALVVAVTAHAFNREHEAARAAGCDAIVLKPYDLLVLADALAKVSTLGVAAFDAVSTAAGGGAT